MKINKNFTVLLLTTLLILSLGFVSAYTPITSDNVTIQTPEASATISGTEYVFNVTVNYDAALEVENYTRIRIWMNSTSVTANTTEELITGWIMNTTEYEFNGTMDTSKVEDGNDYEWKAELWNGSTTLNKSRVGITTNNSIPSTPTGLLPASGSIDVDGTINFSATVVKNETTSCTLRFDGINPGLSVYTMTYSDDSCSYQLTGIPEQTYKWFVRASDESDTTDSSVQTSNVDIKTSAGKAATLIAEGKAKSQGGALLSVASNGVNSVPGGWATIIIGIIVVIALVTIIKKR